MRRHVLCALCSGIAAKSELLDAAATSRSSRDLAAEAFPFYATEDAFMASVDSGCHLCSLIWIHRFPPPANLSELSSLAQRPMVLTISANRYSEVNLGIDTASLSDDRSLQPITIPRDRDLKAWHTSDGPWLTDSTASECTLNLAHSWLRTCQDQHQLCSSQGMFPEGYPRRLLQLSNTNLRPSVRLTEISDSRTDLQYLTLSHCWGGSLPLKLTRDNFPLFIIDIPFEQLPLTFRHAVDITFRLGFQYLWIDALCIKQDDLQDWEAEAPRMGTIYGNSVCTIAALSSKSSSGGCYASRRSLAHLPCKVTTKSGQSLMLHAAMSEVVKRYMQPMSVGVAVSPPLHRRAWVVQERALSARTIYFSQVGIYWECCCAALFETDGEVMPLNLGDMGLKYGMGHVLRRPGLLNAIRDNATDKVVGQIYTSTLGATFRVLGADWHSQWWQMIEQYTRCGITRQSDRWPAVSGMAEVMKLIAGTTIIAGLWQSQLMKELMWNCPDTDNVQPLRLDNSGPTWSWLSVITPVRLSGTIFRSSLTDFVAKLLHVSSDECASIYLEAPLLACPVVKWPSGSVFSRVANEDLSEGLTREIRNGRWWPDTELSSEDLAVIWLLQITRGAVVRGLIVRQMTTDQSRWQRLGSFAINVEDDVIEKPIGNVATIKLL